MVIDSITGALKVVYHELDIRESGCNMQGFDWIGSGNCYAFIPVINAKYPYKLTMVGIKIYRWKCYENGCGVVYMVD